MSIKQKVQDYIMITVYFLGWFFVALLVIAFITFAAIKIDEHAEHIHLKSGYVIEKAVYHDHYWYSTWTLGNFSVTKRNGGGKAYCVTVKDGDESDSWTIPEEQWHEVNIGDYIGR